MKYMFLMYGPENAWNDEERKECMVESLAICDELAAQGKFLAAAPLESITTASTVRVRDGGPLITDGPFAETTEQLGGYFLLELDNLDEAIAVASRLPSIDKGLAEIRPLSPLEGVPPARSFTGVQPGSTLRPYMLLCYDNEATWLKLGMEALQTARAEAVALTNTLNQEGTFLNASPLHPAATATCVRKRDGKRIITDGPFAETHEVLGGFYLILAESKESAIRVAEQHSGARVGAVEVRPLFDLSGIKESHAIS